jgi:hypothetical protein
MKTQIRSNAAHARSEGAQLPLRSRNDLTRLTKADLAYYAAHPIVLRPDRTPSWRITPCDTRHADRVRPLLDQLNVRVEETAKVAPAAA